MSHSQPRAVSAWTWRRMLRDHGPKDPSVRLSLFVLSTWMKSSGIAYPSQRKWAAAVRVSVRTIQRHQKVAVELGWLGLATAGKTDRGWRMLAYRAAVPDDLELDRKDELLSAAIIAKHGDIETSNADDTRMSPASEHRSDTMMSSAHANGHDTQMSSAYDRNASELRQRGDDTEGTS
ncbi:MAG: hypothetical protein JSR66_03105 [Proteobacteria bacterium]|nr:hypothetical protein [Pseudomonadota bacterium]